VGSEFYKYNKVKVKKERSKRFLDTLSGTAPSYETPSQSSRRLLWTLFDRRSNNEVFHSLGCGAFALPITGIKFFENEDFYEKKKALVIF